MEENMVGCIKIIDDTFDEYVKEEVKRLTGEEDWLASLADNPLEG